MKNALFIMIAVSVNVMLSASVFACSTCGCQDTPEVKKAVPVKPKVVFISKAAFQKMQDKQKDLVIIDVLSSKSFANAHIKGAISIPLGELDKPMILKGLDKDKTYVVYCASTKCHASTAAAEILMKNGFNKVYDYKAGLAEWKAAKLPVETAKLCKCGAVKGSPSCCK